MHELIFQNGCYRVELLVRDGGSISIGTMCDVSRGPRGHYVAVKPEQAVSIVRHLCDHVPGVAETVLGKLSEV